jgi:acyl-CoA thioester hydrolase
MKVRVYYEDTDIGGIVYHTNYIKYCERARSEIFFEKGFSPLQNQAGFVVKKIDANFLGFASLGDILEIKTEILKKRAVSILLKQEIYKDSVKIFEMDILLAYVKNGKLTQIPNNLNTIF